MKSFSSTPLTLYDKVWQAHNIVERVDGQTLLYVDRHYAHEGSARGFAILAERGLQVLRPDRTIGVADHYVPTVGRAIGDQADEKSRRMLVKFEQNTTAAGILAFGLASERQGIVHVVGPELGLSQPGMTIVCGDSHTATHGAVGALAFGIGASEVSQVLATQTLWQKKTKTMLVRVEGVLPVGVTAKDIILAIIGNIGASGATGHTIEYGGSAIGALSMEGRMTVCNMSIEAGARSGMVAPDYTTLEWLAQREFAPKGPAFDAASRWWSSLASDEGARYDRVVNLDASQLAPMVTWGTSPEQVGSITGVVPEPGQETTPQRRASVAAAAEYMGLQPGTSLTSIPIQHVFIGSCTNARLEDLSAAATLVRGRKVAAGVRAVVVPGSETVKRDAEALGLNSIFLAAGFEWRHSGCSMCVGMNGDIVPPGERCVSTSNRNFVGRQGVNARTHLASPATAAASAIMGRITDPRSLGIQ